MIVFASLVLSIISFRDKNTPPLKLDSAIEWVIYEQHSSHSWWGLIVWLFGAPDSLFKSFRKQSSSSFWNRSFWLIIPTRKGVTTYMVTSICLVFLWDAWVVTILHRLSINEHYEIYKINHFIERWSITDFLERESPFLQVWEESNHCSTIQAFIFLTWILIFYPSY